MKKRILGIICLSIVLIAIVSLIIANFVMGPFITKIDKVDSLTSKDKVILNVYVDNYFFKINKDTWCYLSLDNKVPTGKESGWIKAGNGYCSFTVDTGDYDVYVKDKYNNINNLESQLVKRDRITDIKMSKETVYLYKGGSEVISYSVEKIGNIDDDVKLSSSDESVATVDDSGNIKGINYGTTYINATSNGGTTAKTKVVVSKFINKPVVDSKKSYISCRQFGTNESEEIDNMLADRINQAGYGTRAGVVAAARFITLEFSYKIPYFYENGRLENYAPYKHVDGEGRYYHKGMYLNESKFSELKKGAKLVGPAIWGCNLQNYTNWGKWEVGKYYPNGLDCSGFVTWSLLNGGFDVGDIGAGGDGSGKKSLPDIGTKMDITPELMHSGRVKVGDLIGLSGHAAILAGWDDNNYYIAESLNTTGGVVMTVVPKAKLENRNSIYTFVVLMDDYYKKDGNLTNYWN